MVAQQISEKDISYIVGTVIPALKELVEKTASGDPDGARKLQDGIDVMTPLLSAEMLTVLQLMGFNFKKAIGEPLTVLIQQYIAANAPMTQEDKVEIARLNTEASLVILRLAEQDAGAEGLKQIMRITRGEEV